MTFSAIKMTSLRVWVHDRIQGRDVLSGDVGVLSGDVGVLSEDVGVLSEDVGVLSEDVHFVFVVLSKIFSLKIAFKDV